MHDYEFVIVSLNAMARLYIRYLHRARCTQLAGSVRDRETLNRRATSSSVITTSSACRHVAMISLLIQLFSNEESTNILPVPRLWQSIGVQILTPRRRPIF
jgi:hypothetical protein